MVRVCMIVHQYYYLDVRVQSYVEALRDAGAQVDVVCVRDPNQTFIAEKSGVRIFTIPLNRGHGRRASYLLEYGVAMVLFAIWLLVLYIRNGYQVIHIHNPPDFLIFAALIPRLFGAKLILDIHDPMPELCMSKYKKAPGSPMVRLLRMQEKLSAMLAHAVITVNLDFRNNLASRGTAADKITVVYNIPDTRIFNRDRYKQERCTRRDRFSLIYPGTIAPRYGLDVAIRALPMLIKKIPHIRLAIIGPQVSYATELSTLAEQLGVSSFVQFKPPIPVDQVPRQLIQADIGIYPALPDPHMEIAIPSKVLEYAAMGIPTVASRLKVLEDLFTESAILFFEPGNVDEFTCCVLELFDNAERREQLVQNADRVFVHTHSWQNEQRAYFGVLNRLLTSGAEVITLSERDKGLAKEIG